MIANILLESPFIVDSPLKLASDDGGGCTSKYQAGNQQIRLSFIYIVLFQLFSL